MEIRCRHAWTLYEKPGFAIAAYKADEPVEIAPGEFSKKKFTAKGAMLPLAESTSCVLHGKWKKEAKYGWTFNVDKYEEKLPDSKKGILKYLLHLKGVGEATAKKLYDAFGDEVFTQLNKGEGSLCSIRGISPKKEAKILASWREKSSSKDLYEFCYNAGLSKPTIDRIYRIYKENALKEIKTNPYQIWEFSFAKADTVAKENGLSALNPERLKRAILETLKKGETGVLRKKIDGRSVRLSSGNTYISWRELIENTYALLGFGPLSQSQYKEALKKIEAAAIILNDSHRIVITREGKNDSKECIVYRGITAKYEYHAADELVRLLNADIPKRDYTKDIAEAEAKLKVKLSKEQEAAVKACLNSPVSIVTGGPGTGKTMFQEVMIAVFKKHHKKDFRLMLCAPTGRAARRMSESADGIPAHTIHHELGLSANDDGETKSSREEDFKLGANLIICDEMSMIDAEIAYFLFRAIETGSQIVMIGDVNQLPSVGCGSVLNELIQSGEIPVSRFTRVYRQAAGSNIATNAARIQRKCKTMVEAEDFQFIEADTSKKIVEEIKILYPKLVDRFGVDEVAILTPYRKTTCTGVNEINPVLRNVLRPELNDSQPHITIEGFDLYEGDKVMFSRNKGELTNGDIGYIKDLKNEDGDRTATVDFKDGRIVELDEDLQEYLSLAYATTIHKSQGSEYTCVIMICDSAHKALLKRNLTYTGITRAKKYIYIVGQKDEFLESIDKEDTSRRNSRLGYLLHKKMEKERRKDENKKTV